MYDTFELLRRVAEDSRKAARKIPAGLDPATWEALLDRVEDQLEMDDRGNDVVSRSDDSSSLHSCAHTTEALSSANKFAQCIAAGVLLAGLGIPALHDRNGYRTNLKKGGALSITSRPA